MKCVTYYCFSDSLGAGVCVCVCVLFFVKMGCYCSARQWWCNIMGSSKGRDKWGDFVFVCRLCSFGLVGAFEGHTLNGVKPALVQVLVFDPPPACMYSFDAREQSP